MRDSYSIFHWYRYRPYLEILDEYVKTAAYVSKCRLNMVVVCLRSIEPLKTSGWLIDEPANREVDYHVGLIGLSRSQSSKTERYRHDTCLLFREVPAATQKLLFV